ncbi:MAG: hypothetical protein KDD42_03435 [Bdellovibrionales bacterium]|nr:hypothetical protein [Bdellovibrionales bacterium]
MNSEINSTVSSRAYGHCSNLEKMPCISNDAVQEGRRCGRPYPGFGDYLPKPVPPEVTIRPENPNPVEVLTKLFGEMFEQLTEMIRTLLSKLDSQREVAEQAPTDSGVGPVADDVASNGGVEEGSPVGETGGSAEQPADQVRTQKLKKHGDFLWKPESSSDGNLVILAPSRLTGRVKGVRVLGPNGKVLARGSFSGVANGDREHFRFNKGGDSFPPGSVVEIQLKGGGTRTVEIKNPSQRYTY